MIFVPESMDAEYIPTKADIARARKKRRLRSKPMTDKDLLFCLYTWWMEYHGDLYEGDISHQKAYNIIKQMIRAGGRRRK